MSLQVWLPLTGHLNNQGLSDVTVTNNGATVDNNGKIGKCYSFNGSSAKITNTLPTTVSSSIGTLACWVKFNAFPQSASGSGVHWYSLIQLGALGGFATCRFGLYMEYTNVINISIDGSDTNKNAYTHSLSTNTWYHLCATYDGTLVKLYINGSQVMSKTATKGTYTTAASYLYCGATNNYWTNGYMNDIRYYNHALSEKEVKELSKGLVLHYPLSAGFGGAENLFRDSAMGQHAIDNLVSPSSTDWTKYFRYYNGTIDNHSFSDGIDTITLQSGTNIGIAFQRKATDIALDSSSYYTISCEAKCEVSGAHLDIGISYLNTSNTWVWRGGSIAKNFTAVDTWQKFTHTFKPDADTQYIMYCFTINSTTGKHFSIRHCKLEKGSVATPWTMNSGDVELADIATTEYDVSGYNNHAKRFDCGFDSVTPRYAVCSSLLGAAVDSTSNTKAGAQYFIGNLSLTNAPTLTLSFWGKIKKYGRGGIFCTTNSTEGDVPATDYNTTAICNWDSNFQVKTANKTVNLMSMFLIDDTWHLYSITYNGASIIGYRDGVAISTTAATGAFPTFNGLCMGLGRAGGVYRQIQEYVSDLRIYITALSADDVKQLYNTAAALCNNGTLMAYSFNET